MQLFNHIQAKPAISQASSPPGYLHICNRLQLLLLLRLSPLEILHEILDVAADLGEIQVHVLRRRKRRV